MKNIKYLLILVMIGVGIWLVYKKIDQRLPVMLPNSCLFSLDMGWSESFQEKLSEYIQQLYTSSKNPDHVIQTALHEFPDISAIDVQICNSDKICFHVQAWQPVFLLNNTSVVCHNQALILRNHINESMLNDLMVVTSCMVDDLADMTCFVQALPKEIYKNYCVDWKNKDEIFLHKKSSRDQLYLVSTQRLPSIELLEHCDKIYEIRPKLSKKNKKETIFDIRFKNQILVRSGGQL